MIGTLLGSEYSSCRHGLPCQDTCTTLRIDCDLTVDQDVGDTQGILLGIIKSGGVDHALWIKDDNIGKIAFLHAAAPGQTEAAGGVELIVRGQPC